MDSDKTEPKQDTANITAAWEEALNAPDPDLDKTPFVDGLLTYCATLGKAISREDFLVGLPVDETDLPDALALRALDRLGLDAEFSTPKKLKANHLPACVLIKDGSYEVVLRSDTEFYYLASDQTDCGEHAVATQEFDAQYGQRLIKATVQLDDIQKRHVGTQRPSHWFWGAFSNQKGLIRDIVLGTFVANILAIAISLFALQVYDRVIPNQSEATLWVLVAGAGIAVVCEAILRVSRAHLMDVSGRRIEVSATSYLFSRLVGMKLTKRPSSPGSLAYLMREFSSVREFFTAASIGSVADIPFVGIFLLLIYGIAGNVVWVIVTGMILIIVPSLLMRKTMMRLSKEMQGGTSAGSKLLTEVCYGHETIKSGRGEALFQRRWEEIVSLNAQKTSQQRLLASMLTYWSVGVQHAAYIGAVVTGVYIVFAGDFTVGTIIAVSILSSRAIAPITQLSGTIARWEQVKTALIGLEEIANAAQDRDIGRSFARKKYLTGDIAIQGVEFAYDPEAPANLKIDQLHLKEGETLCLLGMNGSGKSTLLKIMSGLYSFDVGSVTIDGLDLRQIDPSDVRRNIGYLPQEVRMFSGTLRENLTMGQKQYSEEQIYAASAFSGLDRVIRAHPLGLDLPISDGGDGLSFGQKQTVAMARLFLQNPRIVLLDEPTASLDQNAEADLVKKLQMWLGGRTCILTTHRMGVLSLVDKIAVMSNGSVAIHGAKDDVLRKLQNNTKEGADVPASATS